MLNFPSSPSTPPHANIQDKTEKHAAPITQTNEVEEKTESNEMIWFGPSPPDVHQPPMIFSPSPLRPMTDNAKIGVDDHVKIQLSGFGGCTSLPYILDPSSLSHSHDSRSYISSMNSAYTAIIQQVDPGYHIAKPKLLDIPFAGDIPSPDGLAAYTPELLQPSNDGGDDEILPFTPGTPLKMKGWSAPVDTPSYEKAKYSGFYDPCGGIDLPEDSEQILPFDEETFGRKDTLRDLDLVERAGHAAVRRRKIS